MAAVSTPTPPRAAASKELREGSAEKRAAIIRAARDRFVADGFDRTSMDAVAANAKVSKRTVYDYYGDKHALLLAVFEDVSRSLLESVHASIQRHLPDSLVAGGLPALERGFIDVAMDLITSTIGSSDYAALITLTSSEGVRDELLERFGDDQQPEEAIAERIAYFADAGLLDAPDPRLAAEHFKALTFLLAFNAAQGAAPGATDPHIVQINADGVRAFLRAYRPLPTAGPR